MSDATQPASPEMLLALADQEFEKIVISQLSPNRRTPEIYELLLSRTVVRRTKETLDILRLRTQDTMQAKRADLFKFQGRCAAQGASGKAQWLQGKGRFETDRRKSGHFLKLVEIMQLQVKQPAHEAAHGPQQASAEHSTKRMEKHEAMKTLVEALVNHETVQQEHCTHADETLWNLLDTLTLTWNDQKRTLREMHEAEWN